MKTEINPFLEKFRELVVAEIEPARKAYEKEKKEYELKMKKFIEREITDKKEFKKFFNSSFKHLRKAYEWERASDCVNTFMTLEFIINDYEQLLEQDEFLYGEDALEIDKVRYSYE